jgi:hypothetical protein
MLTNLGYHSLDGGTGTMSRVRTRGRPIAIISTLAVIVCSVERLL